MALLIWFRVLINFDFLREGPSRKLVYNTHVKAVEWGEKSFQVAEDYLDLQQKTRAKKKAFPIMLGGEDRGVNFGGKINCIRSGHINKTGKKKEK